MGSPCVAESPSGGTPQAEPACVFQGDSEQDCLAIAADDSRGHHVSYKSIEVSLSGGSVSGNMHRYFPTTVQNGIRKVKNLPAIKDAGAEPEGTHEMPFFLSNPGAHAFLVQGKGEDLLNLRSSNRLSAFIELQRCREDAPRSLEDQKTPCRSSQETRSSRPRPSNTPALPTPEYPSASRFASRRTAEIFNNEISSRRSQAGERAAKPQRRAPKRGAKEAGLQAAKPRRRKVDSGGD
jgi:hypothetical protein